MSSRRASVPDQLPTRPSIGTAVLGAGPAGLTAALVLARRGADGAVFEAESTVGGLAKTVQHDGYRFDLGGHRFFTKLEPIERLWEEMLGIDLLTRRRLSRIYYDGRFFAYPLMARDVLGRIGLVESALCAVSYLTAWRRRREETETFEEWVTGRFGRRLYDRFFRSYTEKVWGIPGSEIRSEWAAQRIKNFSFTKALLTILHLRREHVTTLIEEFRYPRLGPGQMWEAFAEHVERGRIPIHRGSRCISLGHRHGRVERVAVQTGDQIAEHAVSGVLSSIPLSELIRSLDPPPPADVLEAAERLRYRALCVVALITTEVSPFPDNWIYLHDAGTRAGRVQNFGAWSGDMVKPGTTCLGVEYFCFEEDELWQLEPDRAIDLAASELAAIRLIDRKQVLGGAKVLVPKAYPMYDSAYREAVHIIRSYLETFENLKTFGRNGLHRYNNQDHSMWTAILATSNLLDGTAYNVWSVNTEAVYIEGGEAVQSLLGFELFSGETASMPPLPQMAEQAGGHRGRAGEVVHDMQEHTSRPRANTVTAHE